MSKMKVSNRIKNLALENWKYKNWYNIARRNIKKLSQQHNIPFKTLVGVVAITSQNINLKFNSQLVYDWILNGANIEAVDKIRHLNVVKQNLKYFLETKKVKGPKINAFYNALIGEKDAIVLDTHMASAFKVSKFWTVNLRLKAEKIIQKLSKELQWKNCETQAAIWCGIYRQKNPNKPIANYSF